MLLGGIFLTFLIVFIMKAIEWMTAMLWGASIGAVVAMLCTPYDGKQMRQMACNMWKRSGIASCCDGCDCTAHDMECNDTNIHSKTE